MHLPVITGSAFFVFNILAAVAEDLHHIPCHKTSFSCLTGARVVAVERIEAGDVVRPNNTICFDSEDYTVQVNTSICRVVVDAPSTNTSSVRVEAWLPDGWNSRLLATGNGGLGGCVQYRGLQGGVDLGFASIGSNAGHDGEEGDELFLNKPEVLNDWGFRAVHVEAVVGKQIVARYYGEEATKSYFHGCSTGGRQALQEAAMFPDDFDGIIAASPAINWVQLAASKVLLAQRSGWPYINSSSYVRPEQWTAIVARQIELFDELDGVKDGVIDDPDQIRWDPISFACGTGALNDSVCLNPDQVLSARAVYQPIINSTGDIVWPGYPVGAGTNFFSNNQVNGTAEMVAYPYVRYFWRGAVYNDTTWTEYDFSLQDMDFAAQINPGSLNSVEADLSRFYERGGKLLGYHGMADSAIPPMVSSEYFTAVQSTMKIGIEETQSFFRLFFMPGMDHCSRGPGSWDVGQGYPLGTHHYDAEHNVLLALVDWVEKDKPVEYFIGSKNFNDSITEPIISQRKYCPYPYKSIWDGQGDTNVSSSWTCSFF